MAYIVTHGCDVQRKDVLVCETVDERPVSLCALLVWLPQACVRAQKYGDGRDNAGGVQEKVGCLEDVEGMLKVVVCVPLAVQLTEVLEECGYLG